jgi:hypothetical protein
LKNNGTLGIGKKKGARGTGNIRKGRGCGEEKKIETEGRGGRMGRRMWGRVKKTREKNGRM